MSSDPRARARARATAWREVRWAITAFLVILLALKVAGLASVSWWVILAPLWIAAAAITVFLNVAWVAVILEDARRGR